MLQNYLKRNFLLICIASALVLSGTTLASCVDSGVITQKSEEVEMAANSISSKSADKSVVEVDGVSFETLVSDSVLSVPQPGAETPVKFGIRITNKTQEPIRFSRFELLPNMVQKDGEVVELHTGDEGVIRSRKSDFPLVLPGESVTFFREGILSWKNNRLDLGGNDGFGGFWLFLDLKPGIYKLRFIYQNYDSVKQIYEPEEEVLKGIWTGQVTTPFVTLNLVKL